MSDQQHHNLTVSRYKRPLLVSFLCLVLMLSSYLFGAYSYQNFMIPDALVLFLKTYFQRSAEPLQGKYDPYGRLIEISGKQEIACPAQNKETGVLLVIGQSNSANHAEKKLTTHHPSHVVNYYNGHCYVAGSPLLGATGEQGEFITEVADQLIDRKIYQDVVILSSGIGGSSITRWQVDGDLNQMLMDTLSLMKEYKVTDILWHQGETDFGLSLNEKIYEKSFNSLKTSLRDAGVAAPFFIALATKCGDNPYWVPKNPVTTAQGKLADKQTIFLAANTDELLTVKDRQKDLCHLSESGQMKSAAAYAEAIEHYHQPRVPKN
jgi:hypothetical protein